MADTKELSNLEKYYAQFTPEQLAAKKREFVEKRKKTIALKRAAKEKLTEEAKKLLPEIIAQDLLLAEQKNYVPRQETINKLKNLLDEGYVTVEDLRTKHFNEMSDDGWHRLLKFVFKSNVAQVEDVGLELIRAKNAAIESVERHLRELKKHVREHKEKHKYEPVPLGLLERIFTAEKELNKINMDWAKTLNLIGAFGEKSKAPTLHLHMATPRPKPVEAPVKDVTPPKKISKKETLDSLLGGR